MKRSLPLPRLRRPLISLLAIASCIAQWACGGTDTVKPVTPSTLRSVSGDGQSALVGSAVPVNPSVVVLDRDGKAVGGVSVTFAVASGGGTVTGPTQLSDANGVATVGGWTLGSAAGSNTLTATASGLSGSPVTFTATATPAPAGACGALTPITLSMGQVMTALGGTGICVSGGAAHQEYMLVPFFGTTLAGASPATLSVTGTGLDVVSATVPAARAPFVASQTLGTAPSDTRIRDVAFEARLRAGERRDLPRLFPAARAARARAVGPSMAAIRASVQVGALVTLNANVNSACTNPVYKTARVAAVSQKAIVVADTSNPPGGFTDAQYQQVAVTFDTLVDPLDETAFGASSDVDGNGRIIIFFTRAVNELTPAGSGSYVGGFFWARDLFPTVSVAGFDACPASNYAEMFYLLAPDPNGVAGNAFPTSMVQQVTIGTTAHEFQHLINAARRMYVNTGASDFEAVWLNEGLSHVAEELAFYRESGISPRQDINVTTIRNSTAAVSAFNNYEAQNFSRYASYLRNPSGFGPFADNDSLPTRGSTWALLRYLVDHHLSSDSTQWYQLVNTTATGLVNLQNVFGADVVNEIRDWSLSVYTDDVSFGIASPWQQPSWNFRDIYPALSNHLPFGLTLQSLQSSTTLPLFIVPSGSAYVRFATAAGANALVQWGSAPAGMQMSLVRIQ